MAEKPSFWATLPGILTGIAGLITALAGIFTIAYQAGWIGVKHDDMAEATAPTLRSPSRDAILAQVYERPWTFHWNEPQDPGEVVEYQLAISGLTGDFRTPATTYTVPPRTCSYVTDRSRFNWTWRVRARFRNGRWSPWSETRGFSIAPFDQAAFCSRCPKASKCRE